MHVYKNIIKHLIKFNILHADSNIKIVHGSEKIRCASVNKM